VWAIIRHITHNGPGWGWGWVSRFSRHENGRDAYVDLKTHYFSVMNIATGQEICTQEVTQVPTTPLVILVVSALARKEDMTTIKIENKFKKNLS